VVVAHEQQRRNAIVGIVRRLERYLVLVGVGGFPAKCVGPERGEPVWVGGVDDRAVPTQRHREPRLARRPVDPPRRGAGAQPASWTTPSRRRCHVDAEHWLQYCQVGAALWSQLDTLSQQYQPPFDAPDSTTSTPKRCIRCAVSSSSGCWPTTATAVSVALAGEQGRFPFARRVVRCLWTFSGDVPRHRH
jgi:hypothetical protein